MRLGTVMMGYPAAGPLVGRRALQMPLGIIETLVLMKAETW